MRIKAAGRQCEGEQQMSNKKNTKSKNALVLGIIAVLMVAGIVIGIVASRNAGRSEKEISREKALSQLERKLSKISVSETTPRKAQLELTGGSLADELPDISKYPFSVEGQGTLNLEIFSSTEKSSEGTDGWLNEVAENFNSEHHEIDGQWATISVRPIASGAAIDYIVSGKYVPKLYSPSNELWGEMLEAKGIDITLLEERLAGNTTGLVLSKETADKLKQSYGEVNIGSVIEATVKNEITMGYTNPYASSTGLNFLITALSEFDSTDLLSDSAIKQFQAFQQNVPFVAYTTLQMRDAAEKGVLDAFILEYQSYHNAADLRDYEFVPFGARHDSPMYALGTLTDAENQLAEEFVSYCKNEQNQALASEYGFNFLDDYAGEERFGEISGARILDAQKLWKEEKDAQSPVMAVFVADVSGSMGGAPIQNLKTSLINAESYINETNYIGLISYSSDVTINLPIEKFDMNQRSYFTGAVQDLSPNGNTATYDAVLVAMNMLLEKQQAVEQETGQKIKPMLFVLSDGETNVGNELFDIEEIVRALEIPCYTIGYNANLEALGELSAINEAASINADSDDVIYSLKGLFNAQM